MNMAMDAAGETQRPIRVLPPAEARKIAAGEVIDRPAALVREFLDNAIDAGSSIVELTIEGGGIRRTEVSDDGKGMDREDLGICWQTHATSKIESLDDLNRSYTLGFRGEALAAAAAVSRLEILTSGDGREAWELRVGPGASSQVEAHIEAGRRTRGTRVRAMGLFDSIPARKRFLKREGSEALLCRQALIDKALAFPGISFRFIQDGKLKLFLPPASSLKERFCAALFDGAAGAEFFHEIHSSGEGFSVSIVIGGPEIFRRDRRQQFIFANGRRIQDFSLIQALEYGTQGSFPNGTHPVGAVFITIDPALADFNIHPAKREVRFKDGGAIHHGISSALRDFMRRRGIAEAEKNADQRNADPGTKGRAGFSSPRGGAALAMEALLDNPPDFLPPPGRSRTEALSDPAPPYNRQAENSSGAAPDSNMPVGTAPGTGPETGKEGIRLVGRLFGLFILAEKGDRLYIVDQHAAHERLLYDRFLAGEIPRQELLIPIPFETDHADEDAFIESRRDSLAALGIIMERDGEGWLISALPVNWKKKDAETVKEILSLRQAGEDMAERWAATLSCHSAVRDGDYLDDHSALALAEEALALPDPRCPHGRPVWTEISREALLRAVRRIE